jgi:rare lipoprotein A
VVQVGLLVIVLAFAAATAWAAPRMTGLSSWYGPRFEGRLTASGCPFHAEGLTAASRTLPIGAWVQVRNRRNHRAVMVQITDRGPYVGNRILDLSQGAAEALDMIAAGVVLMDLEVIRLDPQPYGQCVPDDC